VNCHAPIPGDGVPLSISNAQSTVVVELAKEIDAAHRVLTNLGVRTIAIDGSTLTLADRVVMAIARPILAEVAAGPFPPPPFPDDDEMLPKFPPGPPVLSARAMRGLLLGTLLSIAIYWTGVVLWRATR